MDLDASLHRHFGFPEFRPGQREACEAALAGRDVLVVMPTGSGKSLCYQLPALIRDDLTVVVSPLVSLMQDQVESLESAVPGAAALINAQQESAVNREVLDRAVSGDLSLLYVAPERFSSPGFVEKLAQARVGLFVVDEAHCVSEWGHDFRPDYFRLGDAARYLKAEAIVGTTATATPRVADDISKRLGLSEPVRVATGFDRPTLSFVVVPCRNQAESRQRIAAVLCDPDALPAIVYAGTRNACRDLSSDLRSDLGQEVAAYHAGLGREERADTQRRFMAGDVNVIVATNAFGMGVDKADVRTVIHATVPGSVEAYYQEAGRAGRDGKPARALLFAQAKDKGLHVFFIEKAKLEDASFGRVAAVLAKNCAGSEGDRYQIATTELASAAGVDGDGVRAIIGHLNRAGVLRPAPSNIDEIAGRLIAAFDGAALARCRTAAAEAQRSRWSQYRAVWTFVESTTCRRKAILRHFGDQTEPAPTVACCDVCDPLLIPAAPPAALVATSSSTHSARQRAKKVVASHVAHNPAALDAAIVAVVTTAKPGVGRTRTVEILRGGRSKVIQKYAYDGLAPYGSFANLSKDDVLTAVDQLIAAGQLRSTGGTFPKLAVP